VVKSLETSGADRVGTHASFRQNQKFFLAVAYTVRIMKGYGIGKGGSSSESHRVKALALVFASTSMCWLAFARIVAALCGNLRNTAGAHPDLTRGYAELSCLAAVPAPPIDLRERAGLCGEKHAITTRVTRLGLAALLTI